MDNDKKILDYLNKIITDDNKLVLLKLLSLETSTYRKIIDLLVDYKLTLKEIDAWGDYSEEGIRSLIDTYDLKLNNYYTADGLITGDLGKSFILNDLEIKSYLNESILESLNFGSNSKNIFDMVLKIKISDSNSKYSYKSLEDFTDKFNSEIWANIKESYNVETSLHEIFPYHTETQIEPLFAEISDDNIKTLGLNIYESIFRRFFYPRDFLDEYNNGLIYLAYHINDRYSKLENEVVLINNLLNINYKNYEYINSIINNIGSRINERGSIPIINPPEGSILQDDIIDSLVSHLDEIDFSRNIEFAMNAYYVLVLIYERFYKLENSDYMKVYNIIYRQLELFKEFIIYYIDLSNNYLLTYE